MTGILTIPADQYHADPCDEPSLSASIAHILCSQSPAHARAAHPKLNPDMVRDEKGHYDVGTAAHSILLQGDRSQLEIIDAPDWRTNAAKDARDQARADGKIPLLANVMVEVDAMVSAALEQLNTHAARPLLFTEGQPEQTLVWEEKGGVICRARLDWLRDDRATIDDYKSAHDCNPENWNRRAMFSNGYDVQAAFYLRGLKALTGVDAIWRWVVQEKTFPYSLVVVTPGSDVLEVANAKVEYALKRWRRCLRTGVWPGYVSEVVVAELPSWADDAKWLVDEYTEAAA